MKLPLAVDASDQWEVGRDVAGVNVTNLNTLVNNFPVDALRKAFSMEISVRGSDAAHPVRVALPGPCTLVARPILEGGSIVGHRIGARYVEPVEADRIGADVVEREQPFVLWYGFAWSTATEGQALKTAVQAHFDGTKMLRAGAPGILARRSPADVQATLAALTAQGITIPDHQDGNPAGLSAADWTNHLFDLWWYGLSYIQMQVPADSSLADVSGAPLLTASPDTRVGLTVRGRFAFQPFHSDPVWINPGYVLQRYLSATDQATAANLGLIYPPERAYLVGVIPTRVEDVQPYLCVGNEDRGWRYFLPVAGINMGFSFVTWDRLYLAHNGTSATLTLSGGGLSSPIQGQWWAGEYEEIILNRDLRPPHPAFRTDQGRTIAPLSLKIEVAGTASKSLTLEQDEPDIIRQEFGLHMNWKQDSGQYYYQDARRAQGIPSDDDVPVGNKPHFKIPQPSGTDFLMGIPARSDLRLMRRDELAAYERRVLESSRSPYGFTLLRERWLEWFEAILAAYEDLRAAILADPAGVGVPPFFPHYIGRLATELGAPPNLADHIPEGLQVSSSWRPPQHNEAAGGAYASFHQSGLALDIQSQGTGPGRRRPIAMAILHHVASGLIGSAPTHLRTALLELGGALFLFGKYRDEYRDWEIREQMQVGSRKVYRMAQIVGGSEQTSMTCGGASGETTDVGTSGGLRQELLDKYVVEGLGFGSPDVTVDWPNMPGQNRYGDLYWFGLKTASHVHVDFYDS